MRRVAWLLVAVVALGLLALLAFLGWQWLRPHNVHASAYFPRTVALYQGSEVRILGVPVGKVTKVVPGPDSVRVDFQYNDKYKVPADTKAVLIQPSLVGDRYLQLTPAYRSGPVLRDGADIPLARTATPVEFDRLLGSLNELTSQLAPQAPALSKLLEGGATVVDGQGEQINQLVQDLSKAASILADPQTDLFGTLNNLQGLVSALAKHDPQLRSIIQNTAGLTSQLAADRGQLAAVLRDIGPVLEEVNTILRQNKGRLAGTLQDATRLTETLVRQQGALREILQTTPALLGNLQLAYNPNSGTLDARPVNLADPLLNPGLFLCSLLSLDGRTVDCRQFMALTPLLTGLPIGDPVTGRATGQFSPLLDRTLAGILGGRR